MDQQEQAQKHFLPVVSMAEWLNKSYIDCHQGAVRAVRYNVDGNYALTAGSDRTVKLWNPTKASPNESLQTFVGHGLDVLDCRSSCDNSLVVTASADKSCALYDVQTGRSLRRWRGHAGSVLCVAFNEDASLVLSGGIDGIVGIWDVRNKNAREALQTLEEAKDAITSVTCSDHEILVSSLDGRVRRYDIRVGKMMHDNAGTPVTRACFTSDGKCILVSCLGGVLHLIDKHTGECLQQYKGHSDSEFYLDIGLGAHGMRVFSGSEDGHVFVWALVEANIIYKIRHPVKGAVHSLSHHPEQNSLLTASKGLVYLWTEQDS
ncbi:WD repeat domain-containing protein 83-like [Tropilaelaps mercedesae]|uniref:WD repeat domain-containing protein 83 n=1 Tax=Tropilaelaps mercedesae TaxID=418985 RepID=A0A1V9XGX2_9ACAR|nr:WD repeat domain-containing protein 83-like [Tropilaelaps mercedesae]